MSQKARSRPKRGKDALKAALAAEGQKKPSKYRNRRATYKGISFDSGLERDRYIELTLLQRAGEIYGLKRQAAFPLHTVSVEGERLQIGKYLADFTYYDKDKRLHVEDTKGFETPLFKFKKKLFEAEYMRKIELVKRKKKNANIRKRSRST